jgi:hypothetical protein
VEISDSKERERAWKLLVERHPNLGDFGLPDDDASALIRARCKYVSVLDYTQGIGHTEDLVIEDG